MSEDKNDVMSIICDCISIVLDKPLYEIIMISSKDKLQKHGMDSLRYIDLIIILEERFKIEIYDSDLLLENFESKEKILTTLKKYQIHI